MNAFGDFLYELRKEKGMTQANLAERLGVTNKAVSKWETGEALPETSLLVPIAEVFGVTVDELLKGRRSGADGADGGQKCDFETGGEYSQYDENEKSQTVGDKISEAIRENLFTRGKDDEPETVADKICGALCAGVLFCGLTVYLFLGAFANLWHPLWVIVPACTLASGIIGIVFNLVDGTKRKRRIENGYNPYTESACGIIILACIITYLLLGALAGLWHPYWFIIIAGVFADVIIGCIGNCFTPKNK